MEQLIKPKSFLDFYKSEISPRLSNIDLILKETAEGISTEQASSLLEVSIDEIKSALYSKNIKNITSKTIMPLMLSLDSFICGMLKREIEYGCPYFYSPAAVSYIYNIDKNAVKNAFDFLELDMVTEAQLPAIFAQVFLSEEKSF